MKPKFICEYQEDLDEIWRVSFVDEWDEDGDPLFTEMIADFHNEKDAIEYIEFRNKKGAL